MYSLSIFLAPHFTHLNGTETNKKTKRFTREGTRSGGPRRVDRARDKAEEIAVEVVNERGEDHEDGVGLHRRAWQACPSEVVVASSSSAAIALVVVAVGGLHGDGVNGSRELYLADSVVGVLRGGEGMGSLWVLCGFLVPSLKQLQPAENQWKEQNSLYYCSNYTFSTLNPTSHRQSFGSLSAVGLSP